MVNSKTVKNKLSNINDVAELLGVSPSTLKRWELITCLGIERDSKNSRKYTQDNINKLVEIKNLVVTGKPLSTLKNLFNKGVDSDHHQNTTFEIITDEPNFDDKLDLILKPYTDRISSLEKDNSDLTEETKGLYISIGRVEGELNKYNEIISLKDSILQEKEAKINELKDRLNKLESRKWWQIWR